MNRGAAKGRAGVFGAILVLALLGAAAQYGFFSHQAPKGQPPMAEMNSGRLDAFKTEFNAASSQFRLIVLLSPT